MEQASVHAIDVWSQAEVVDVVVLFTKSRRPAMAANWSWLAGTSEGSISLDNVHRKLNIVGGESGTTVRGILKRLTKGVKVDGAMTYAHVCGAPWSVQRLHKLVCVERARNARTGVQRLGKVEQWTNDEEVAIGVGDRIAIG